MEETTGPTEKDNAKGEGEEKGGKNKKEGKSQYLIDREKNIERNRELLASFFDALGGLKGEEQATKKKKKEGKNKTKAEKGKAKADNTEIMKAHFITTPSHDNTPAKISLAGTASGEGIPIAMQLELRRRSMLTKSMGMRNQQ